MGARGLIAVGVPPQATWLLWIKVAILVLSLLVLAMGAWALSIDFGYSNALAGYLGLPGTGGGGFAIFIAIWSFIVYGGGLALELFAPQFFYRIASFVIQILAMIFWLSAWAWCASLAALWNTSYNQSKDSLRGSPEPDYVKKYKDAGAALSVCAALGAVAWILTIVHFIFFTLACFRDTEAEHQAELGHVKQEAAPAQYQQQAYPVQQPYPQQPQVQAYPQQQAYPAQ